MQVAGALGLSNRRLESGKFDSANREYLLETGEFLRTADDVRNVVVGVANGSPVFVRNVAEVADGGAGAGRIRAHGQGVRPPVPARRDHRGCQAQRHQRGGRIG